MYKKLLAVTVVGAMISSAAIAQNANQTASAKGEWQASKLIRMNVYNSQNEKIGDIKEILVDKSGKVDLVAIAVGGFLGVGERDVAVKFDQLKWVDVPASSNTSSSGDRSTATTGSNQKDTDATKSNRTYPDHAVLEATKDQLKAMPRFDYNK